MQHKLAIYVLLLAMAVGCSRSTSQNTPQNPADTPATSQTATQQKKTLPPPPSPESSAEAEQKASQNASKPSGPVSPTPRPGMLIEKAAVGSGDKGRGYEPGIITTPVSTYFAARERIMFEIQIPEFIRAYKFEHDFKGPQSHEEFMGILKKNGVKLPTLPPGHVYIYDPKTEELMVERPQVEPKTEE